MILNKNLSLKNPVFCLEKRNCICFLPVNEKMFFKVGLNYPTSFPILWQEYYNQWNFIF